MSEGPDPLPDASQLLLLCSLVSLWESVSRLMCSVEIVSSVDSSSVGIRESVWLFLATEPDLDPYMHFPS